MTLSSTKYVRWFFPQTLVPSHHSCPLPPHFSFMNAIVYVYKATLHEAMQGTQARGDKRFTKQDCYNHYKVESSFFVLQWILNS